MQNIGNNNLGVYLAGDGLAPAMLDENGVPVVNSSGDRIQMSVDENGVFRPYGYTGGGLYQQREDDGLFLDFDITSQIDKHLT